MASSTVMQVDRVAIPELDQAFLPDEEWDALPAHHFVRAENGDAASHATVLRAAWSHRGVHLRFLCYEPDTAAPIPADDVVGVFLDPAGERRQYMTLFINPFGQVAHARIENPLHHALHSARDASWQCPGLRVRSWSRRAEWMVELLIPFSGITPAIDPPRDGDRWTGNFYRVAHHPTPEISAWQPLMSRPPDLHDSERFGILLFTAR